MFMFINFFAKNMSELFQYFVLINFDNFENELL